MTCRRGILSQAPLLFETDDGHTLLFTAITKLIIKAFPKIVNADFPVQAIFAALLFFSASRAFLLDIVSFLFYACIQSAGLIQTAPHRSYTM